MAKPSVVLDTNVVVSAHLAPQGLERRVLDLALAGEVRFCVSAEILYEYEEVLARPKFSILSHRLAASLALIRSRSVVLVARRRLDVATDPGDNKFLECAEAADADYLVTGNQRHFPKRWRLTRIVNARQLIEELIPNLDV